MTMSARNSITDIQEAYVKKVIDTLNDLPNVLWEISKKRLRTRRVQAFMIDLLHAYEWRHALADGRSVQCEGVKHPSIIRLCSTRE